MNTTFLKFCFLIFFCISAVFNASAKETEYIYGVLQKSNEGYYFHTDVAEIKGDVWLKTVSSNISMNLAMPIRSRVRSKKGNFIFHSLYAYKIDEQGQKNLKAHDVLSVPAIILNKNKLTFDNNRLIYSVCSSTEGFHYSIWKKGSKAFERVWSIYTYVGYDIEPNCKDWEIAN